MQNLIAKLNLDVSGIQSQLDKAKGTIKHLEVKLDIDTKDGLSNVENFTSETKSKFSELKNSITSSLDLSQITNFSIGGLISGGIQSAIGSIGNLVSSIGEIGAEYETNLKAVQAVTGSTDELMGQLSASAKGLAETFGGDASNQLKSFQGVLSRFGADLAKSPKDLETVANSINLLGKAGGLDAAASMDALTNSMLQFGVDTTNANETAQESARFINVLAASAKVGAAEIPQVAGAVLVVGSAAKGAGLSFEETNAAIQTFAAKGLLGSEAGTKFRNVLNLMQKQSGEGDKVLKQMGLTTLELGRSLQTAGLAETVGKFQKGLEKIKDPIERNQALLQLFGENSAAMTYLLEKGENGLKDWTAQMTGTNEATIQAKTNMSTFSEQMSRFNAFMSNVAINIFETFNKGAGSLFEPIVAGFKDFVKIISDGLGKINLGPIIQVVGAVLSPLLVGLGVAWGLFKESLSTAFDVIAIVINKIGEVLKPLIDRFSGITSVSGGINNAFAKIVDFVNNVLLSAFETLIDVIAVPFEIGVSAIGFLLDSFNSLVTLITSTDAFQFLVDIFNSFYNQIEVITSSPFVTWIQNLGKSIGDLVGSVLSSLFDVLVKIGSFISEILVGAVKGLISIFNSIYSVIQSFIKVLSSILDIPIVKSFIDPLVAGLKSIGGLIGGLIDSVLKFFGLIGEKKEVKVKQKIEQETKLETKQEVKTEVKPTQAETSTTTGTKEEKKDKNTFLKEKQDLDKKALQLTNETEKNQAKLREQYLKQSIKELEAEISQDRELTYSIVSPSENTTLAFLEANLKTMQNKLDAQKLELGTKLEAQDTILSINLKLIDNEFQQKLADIENKYNATRTEIENKIIQVKTSTTLTNDQKLKLQEELNNQLVVEYKNYESQTLILQGEKLEKEQKAVSDNEKTKQNIKEQFLKDTLKDIENNQKEIDKINKKASDELLKTKQKEAEELKKFNDEIQKEYLSVLTNIPNVLSDKIKQDKDALEKEKNDLKSKLADLKKETTETTEKKKKPANGQDNRDIFEDAKSKLSEIEQIEAKLRELENKGIDWDKILRGSLDASLDSLSNTLNKSLTKEIETSINNLMKLKGGALELGDAFDVMSDVMGLALTQMGIASADALVNQQNVAKAFLLSFIDVIQQSVNMILVKILANEIESKGWLGVASYAGLAALINTALSAAKAGIGAEDGVIGINSSYNKKAGKTDTIPLWVAPGESIISADKTSKYKDILQQIHAGTYKETYKVLTREIPVKEKSEVTYNVKIDYDEIAKRVKLESNHYDRRKIVIENKSNSVVRVAR